MANCLMQMNQCGFPNCGQHFANQYDLTAHIEYTHIPVIEEDVRRKAQAAAASAANGEPPVQQSLNNLPLSYYSRVFRTAYRPNPIKPEPLKVSFNHYKKRALKEKQLHPNHLIHRVYREMLAAKGRNGFLVSLEDVEKRLGDVDFEECGPENKEIRYPCQIVDCNKRYKNMFALRMHMKIAHAVVIAEDAKCLTNYPLEDVKPNLQVLQQQMMAVGADSNSQPMTPSGTNMAPPTQLPAQTSSFGNPATNSTSYRCSLCTKRYKTPTGLSNHMMTSHHKILVSEHQDAPSPQVVEQLISQARMQRQQQEQNNPEQLVQQQLQQHQKPVPTGSATLGSLLKNGGQMRSYTVQSNGHQAPMRFNQQHYQVNMDNQPSTGQVLQMQMQHQRRLKQMQEQQAAQQQQQMQQQQQGGHNPQGPPGHFAQMPQQPMGPPLGSQVQQGPPSQGPSQPQQLGGSMHQQYHQMPPPQHQQLQHQQQQQQPQQQYPQQIHHHQMVQQGTLPHHFQQPPPYQPHQQSPQFPFQQPSQQQQQPSSGPPQRSPIPLSQALPPLNSMAPGRAMHQSYSRVRQCNILLPPTNRRRNVRWIYRPDMV